MARKKEEIVVPEWAKAFFVEFYGGEHHFPRTGINRWGDGFCILHDQGDLATYDYNQLTKLVLMGHERCIRVSIQPHAFKTVRISIWQREREGSISHRHPTIEQAIEAFRPKKADVTE